MGIGTLKDKRYMYKIHIIAHCMGCCTSLKYAHNNAGKVETLTLLSPFIPKSNNLQRLRGVNYQD